MRDEVEHEALMRQSMQPSKLKLNEKMDVGGVLNRDHGKMWIVRDCKCFSKRQKTPFEQICISMEDPKKMVKIWQEIFHLVRSAEPSSDPASFLLHLQFTEAVCAPLFCMEKMK